MGSQLSVVLQIALGLLSLWGFIFYVIRSMRTDNFRFKLLVLREELFDFAHSGAIDFNHESYIALRDRIDKISILAHHITFTRMVVVWFKFVFFPYLPTSKPFNSWKASLNTIQNPFARQHLDHFQRRLVGLVADHVIFGSPSLICAMFFAVMKFGLRNLGLKCAEVFTQWLENLDVGNSKKVLFNPSTATGT